MIPISDRVASLLSGLQPLLHLSAEGHLCGRDKIAYMESQGLRVLNFSQGEVPQVGLVALLHCRHPVIEAELVKLVGNWKEK